MQLQNRNARVLVNKMTPRTGSGHSRGSGGSGGGPGSAMARYSMCLVLLNLVLVNLAAGQFFTKSSKSIPRMGRRSLPDYKSELEAYQQLLAEEYEQNLINDALERQQKLTLAADDETEQAIDRNQKLSDLLKLNTMGERSPRSTSEEIDAADAPKAMTRNERARPQLFGGRLAAAAAVAAAVAQQQQQRDETAARLEQATRERAW